MLESELSRIKKEARKQKRQEKNSDTQTPKSDIKLLSKNITNPLVLSTIEKLRMLELEANDEQPPNYDDVRVSQ